ncbi:hypothetical protein ACWF99_22700 [Nocardia sp. NPDC055002]
MSSVNPSPQSGGAERRVELAAVRRWMNDLSDDRDLSVAVAEARTAWQRSSQQRTATRPVRGVERSR